MPQPTWVEEKNIPHLITPPASTWTDDPSQDGSTLSCCLILTPTNWNRDSSSRLDVLGDQRWRSSVVRDCDLSYLFQATHVIGRLMLSSNWTVVPNKVAGERTSHRTAVSEVESRTVPLGVDLYPLCNSKTALINAEGRAWCVLWTV